MVLWELLETLPWLGLFIQNENTCLTTTTTLFRQIRLAKLSEETGCSILGKAEFQNPGGSVKDRAALYVVKDAEDRGL